MKYTKKFLKDLFKSPKENFGKIIDYVMYYSGISEDVSAWDIIYELEDKLEYLDLAQLIVFDYNSRDFKNSETLLYDAIIIGMVNNEEAKDVLIGFLTENKPVKFIEYLTKLDKGKGRIGDLNVKYVIDRVNAVKTKKDFKS